MTRKLVPRVPEEELPPYRCSECWFYETIEIDHGACYGIPPKAVFDKDGDMIYPRVIVLSEDRGCHLFRPRHTA